MKKALTLICFSCFWLFAISSEKSNGITCGDEIGVIQNFYQINFGDTIDTGISSEEDLSVSWNVFPTAGLNVSSGTGKMTGDLIFSQPGEYQITFNIPAHGDHAAKMEVVQVKVGSTRMNFDVKNIHFSNALKVGQVSGLTMTIPVTLKSFDGKSVEYTAREIQTTGAAKISTKLKNEKKVLKDGLNELTFELNGTISSTGNVQFRFSDLQGNSTFFNYQITN